MKYTLFPVIMITVCMLSCDHIPETSFKTFYSDYSINQRKQYNQDTLLYAFKNATYKFVVSPVAGKEINHEWQFHVKRNDTLHHSATIKFDDSSELTEKTPVRDLTMDYMIPDVLECIFSFNDHQYYFILDSTGNVLHNNVQVRKNSGILLNPAESFLLSGKELYDLNQNRQVLDFTDPQFYQDYSNSDDRIVAKHFASDSVFFILYQNEYDPDCQNLLFLNTDGRVLTSYNLQNALAESVWNEVYNKRKYIFLNYGNDDDISFLIIEKEDPQNHIVYSAFDDFEDLENYVVETTLSYDKLNFINFYIDLDGEVAFTSGK